MSDQCDCEFVLVEQPIYGLGRVGVSKPNIDIYTDLPETETFTRDLGEKSYELTDHLGNVKAVISDRKLTSNPGAGDYYAEFLSYTNAYPYGMPQPGRAWADSSYRYGFNGMESDGEVKLAGDHHYTTFFRQYDPRVARWWSVDPIDVASSSSYESMASNPIRYKDPNGDTALAQDAYSMKSLIAAFKGMFASESSRVFQSLIKADPSDPLRLEKIDVVDYIVETMAMSDPNERAAAMLVFVVINGTGTPIRYKYLKDESDKFDLPADQLFTDAIYTDPADKKNPSARLVIYEYGSGVSTISTHDVTTASGAVETVTERLVIVVNSPKLVLVTASGIKPINTGNNVLLPGSTTESREIPTPSETTAHETGHAIGREFGSAEAGFGDALRFENIVRAIHGRVGVRTGSDHKGNGPLPTGTESDIPTMIEGAEDVVLLDSESELPDPASPQMPTGSLPDN